MNFKAWLMQLIKEHELSRVQGEYMKLIEKNQELTGKADTYFFARELPVPHDMVLSRPTSLHPDLKGELKELENSYEEVQREFDYLNNFLSVLFRPNVPKKVKEAIIPRPILEQYENRHISFVAFPKSHLEDTSLTEEYIREVYEEEIYCLNKYLVYLMI